MASEQDKSVKPQQGKPGKEARGKPAKGAPEEKGPAEPIVAPRLRDLYREEIRGRIAERFGVRNPMAMPRLEKITVNVNMGRHLEGTKIPAEKRQTVIGTLTKITGQKPVVQKARKSVSNFKLRAGMENSAVVTLRRERMWHFLDRLINLAAPRVKDFRGFSRSAFDAQGNYSMGFGEQGVFPEINMAEVNFTHGMNVNLTFRNSTPALSAFVLEQMGMPFAKDEKPEKPARRAEPAPAPEKKE